MQGVSAQVAGSRASSFVLFECGSQGKVVETGPSGKQASCLKFQLVGNGALLLVVALVCVRLNCVYGGLHSDGIHPASRVVLHLPV
jgi:hypothetical protein